MVVVTGGPPLTLLFTILMVLLVLERPVVELVPDVNVLEESPLTTVRENSGISIELLEGSPPITTVLDGVGRWGAGRMAWGGGGAGLSGAGYMGEMAEALVAAETMEGMAEAPGDWLAAVVLVETPGGQVIQVLTEGPLDGGCPWTSGRRRIRAGGAVR